MWDINDIAPESEAVQAEREVWEDLARRELQVVSHGCDRCGEVTSLYHNEASGLALCGPCDTAADVETPVDTTVSFKRLRNGAWGITGPARLLVTGQLVAVTKRNGETTTVRVGRVLWSGDGKAIAATRRA